jgi:hypothetical protein
MGNCTAFEFEPAVEVLEHFSSMTGVRSKDYTVVLEKSGTINVTLEEMTAENMALMLLGEIVTDSDGNKAIDILSEDLIRGRLEIIGSNDVGPKWDFNYPSVAFRPNGSINSIAEDDWSAIELTGEVEMVNGIAGRATLQDSAVSEPVS